MASEVSVDLNIIHDEDVLRRMWQQTDDFGRKKEIRQRMYKLREQRLRDFYTGDNSDMTSRKHAGSTYTDSIADQGFMSLKSKEIRDSESPTRDIHKHQGDSNYWNTVQQSSYSDDGGVKSYERSSTGTGQSADGATKLKLESDERGFAVSNVSETENAKTISDKQQHDAHIATASHTKTDFGEAYSYSTSQEHQESSSAVTESKDANAAYKSNKWETSSVSSASSRKVISSSNYGKVTSDIDLKALTSEDDVDFSKSFSRDEDNTATIRRIHKSSNNQENKYQTCEESNSENRSGSRTFIDSETRNNIKNNLQDINVSIIEDHFADRDSRRDSTSTYTSELTSNVDDYVSQKDLSTKHVSTEKYNVERNSAVVDQNIMTEINKLDTFLSTQHTGTNTPASPHSVMGEVNWTVVSNNDGEFVYGDDKDISGSRATPVKQPDNLDFPKECTEGQYMTTYNEHYTSKRISVDVSPTHDKFARSLRQTPPETPRSLSRQSLDRSSPERKTKGSPRSSPDKERRVSTGSYTIERPGSARRKSSEVTRQTATSRDSTLKTKRKLSSTQNKATTKVRTSTPGTSPSTSPSRKHRERSESASSASDSDASQVINEKKITTNIHKRADVVRKNLMKEFDKESIPTKKENSETPKTSSRPSSPEKSPSKQTSNARETNTSKSLRRESITSSKVSVRSTIEQKISTGIAPHLRGTSPEYSSEGSVGKEIKNSQRKATPDSSPDRAAFTPIKQFRTSPEESSETIQVIVSETDRVLEQPSTSFITNEKLDAQQEEIEETIEMNKNKTPTDNFTPFNERTKENEVADRKHSQNEKSPSSVEETDVTRKITNIRKDSTNRGKPSNIEDKSRAQSPSKNQTTKKSLFNQRSPSPTKERPRSVSPTKIANGKNPHESTQPQKSISRSPSPAKKESVTVTTSTTTTRKSSLKKESSFKDSLASRKFSRENTSSPVKQLQKSRSPSPEKQSPERKSPTEKTGSRSPSPKKTTNRKDTSSPTKSLSPSPQRGSSKRSHHLVSSPSISPCSSPERSNDKKQDKPKILHKTISKKSVDLDTQRTTRRSSIPRAEQSTVVRKTVETKIEIRSKPVTKIASPINKPKSSTSLKITKTDSQNSMDRTVSLRSHSTTLKKTEDKPKEPIKKTNPTSKKIVTTTAVISVQKPSVPVQTKHITTTTVARASTYKRTPSKEITPKKTEPSTNKKPIVTTTTKRIASRTNTPKSSKAPNQDETIVDTVTNDRVTSDAFIERLRNDESVIHGYKDETINFEITDLEDETRPELYPETEEDEEISERQDTRIDKQNEHHKTEKTILVDSKPKATSQFVVTIKKPTPKTPSTRPVTIRSSSGPIKGSPHASAKPTQTKGTVTKRNVTSTVQKSESLNMIRTKSDKSIPKTTPQSREVSKPEISTGRFTPANKASPSKQVTETGIASRNITTARSATMKRVTPTKKRPADYQPSSSEDEGQNIPSVVTPNRQEQQYIEELEEMRRNEELEYASKLTATTNQENQLLSVIVQHPKSSRESSPDMSNKSQPFCTVSDDGGSNPRYADIISEPEDVEVFNPKEVLRQPRFEQVTDLDEESEAEEIKLDVSVADRVSHFLETSKNHAATHIREDVESELSTDKAKNVLKAAAMFETIARNQTAPPAPSNKAPDILSRPSVFEARKGQTAPKTISPDIPPRVDTVNEVQMTQPAQVNHRQKEIIDIYETDHFEQVDISKISDSPDYIKPTEEIEILKYKKEASDVNVNPLQNGADTNDRPEKTPKTDPTSRTVKIPSMDKKKIESPNKSRPFEKTISASAEISSKRAFFERKAQTDTTTKQTKAPSMFKERKPLTESVQNKENIRGSSPTRKSSKMTSFIENERKTSRTSPERKTVSPERKISETSPNRKISKPSLDKTNTSPERRSSASPPAKERKHSVKSESPERKMSFTKSVKERRSSFTKEDITTCQTTTLQNKVVSSKNQIERKISPSRESPERRAPITQKLFPDHVSKVTPDRDITELKSSPSPVKDKSPVSPESPERSFSRKISRTSPERSVKSPERRSSTQNAETETVELNKAGKFGVTLRRTSSTTSAGSPRRSSVPGETQEIEEVTDMTLLEIMMEKAVGYEQRRRIRAQMRIVKKILDDKTNSVKVTRQKSPTRSPSRQPTQHTVESKKPERRPSSPNKQTQESLQSKKSERRPSSPTKQTQESFEPRKSERRPSSPTKQTQESFEPRKSERRPSSPTKQTQESLQSKKSERRPSSPTKQTQESFEPRKSERRPSSPTKQTQESFESKKPDRRPSSPTKSVQEMVNVEQKVVRKTSKPSELKAKTNLDAKQSPSITNGYISPQSPGRASPTRKESTIENFQGVRKNSKTETEVTSVRSQKRVETLVESGVDCITSSYGVGPTDENGRPLFGLRALRRTNTNKQLTDDNELVTRAVEERKEVRTERTEEVVRDTNGRPLFGGLRALRAKDTRDTDSDTDCWDMPEQTTSTQLRELVQRHEKVVRETNGPQDQPRQKPRAKLRDSFILTDDEGKEPQPQTEGHLSEVNNLNRGLSLKSIIQKHENISTTGGVVQSEVESSHTVVSSRTAVASDGTVSHSRDVIRVWPSQWLEIARLAHRPATLSSTTDFSSHGEMSAKNGEEPVGKVTRSQYTYKSPRGEDEGVNKLTTTTTTLGGRRTSGPKITEVEDDGKTKRSSVTEETSGLKVRKSSLKKVPSEDEKSKRRFSSQENEETKTVSKISSTAQKFTIDDSKTKFSTESRTKTSSPTLRRQKSSDEETVEEKKKIVRGDSVRALQHKFQQATENSSNNTSGVRSTSARAGLILRTSSFTSTAPPHKSQESVSSTLKQSTPLPAEKKSGRQSPDKRRESPISDTATARKESLTKSSSEERRESLTTTRVSGASSFLDNTTKVTGVQDILSRMRNADLVNESGDTDADREARALLNKFLGASVILQGLEQGARGANISDVTPGSAALVSSVEKQRVATTRQKEEDIENIWDEQVLKNLLEQCTDYDGRRKLRARLRTVMAEHKACADLIALTGDSVANSESSESRQVTTRTEGNSFTRTEVHTRTSTNRLTKASSVSSPFAKFRQLERQNSAPSVGAAPLFRVTDPRVARSASSIKDRLLSWVQAQTREYKNIQIENFSTSWNNGLAFCALIHHFCPNAFDYDQLTPEQRRHNFELAFRVAEEEAGIAPLLDVEDMVVMRRPDWKCVFTYVQSVYRRFHSTPEAVRC